MQQVRCIRIVFTAEYVKHITVLYDTQIHSVHCKAIWRFSTASMSLTPVFFCGRIIFFLLRNNELWLLFLLCACVYILELKVFSFFFFLFLLLSFCIPVLINSFKLSDCIIHFQCSQLYWVFICYIIFWKTCSLQQLMPLFPFKLVHFRTSEWFLF